MLGSIVETSAQDHTAMAINISLSSTDIEATRLFYRDTLGFGVFDTEMDTLTAQFEDCTFIFFEDTGKAPGFSGTFYCFVNDVDAFYLRVKDDVTLDWPLQNMSYGTREFALKDNNGYRLAFAQSLS